VPNSPQGSGTALGTAAVSFRAVDPEPEVVVLRWPDQQHELGDLARRGIPRLLLVEPASAPPACSSCLEDWMRLPVDEIDLQARVRSLAEHRRTHARPTLDEFGVLRQESTIVFLPPREQALAEVLIASFGEVVRDQELAERVFGDDLARREALRTHTSRLRKRIAPLGLTISCIRNVGYMLHTDGGSMEPCP
jgi:Transcriptional regulatory protein, C terminal